MVDKQWLVLATRNRGKTKEIRELLKDFPINIKNLDDFGPIPEIEEDGATFDENAFKKASFTARILGMPTMGDDSGLKVEALNGAPGIYSARYAGTNASDQDNNAKLLREMEGMEDRSAAFICLISIAVPCGKALTYKGRCEGLIHTTPVGKNGFGYDPVFYYPSLDKTFGQLSSEEKNLISHRGKALAEVKQECDKVMIWIRQHL